MSNKFKTKILNQFVSQLDMLYQKIYNGEKQNRAEMRFKSYGIEWLAVCFFSKDERMIIPNMEIENQNALPHFFQMHAIFLDEDR